MQSLLLEHAEDHSLITLNRPERRNAISAEMLRELPLALAECAARPGTPAVILTGAGAAFCSGMDLELLRAAPGPGAAGNGDVAGGAAQIADLFAALADHPAPTVAAVNGAAVAGGCGLALLCDFTLASPAARFGFPEARIGFIPALVAPPLLAAVGEKRARDLLLSGRLLAAEEALAWGLAGALAPATELLERARALAADLWRNSPASLRATKRLLRELPGRDPRQARALAAAANAAQRETADFREGLDAFLSHRAPRWSRVEAPPEGPAA